MASRTVRLLGGLVVPISVIGCWQALKSAGFIDYQYLPSPVDVLSALVELTHSGELARDVAHTLTTAALAFSLAMILGAAAGLAIGLAPAVRRHVMASVDFLRTIPAVALVPVAVLAFGPTSSTEVVLAAYAALWPIVLHTAAGAATVHPRHYDVARMLRFGPATTLRKIVIPAVIPAWVVGARISAIIALLVAVLAEMIMYPRGLGGGLIESMHALAPARMWAYALVCGIVGALLNAGLRYAVHLMSPGHAPHTDTDRPAPAPALTALRGLVPIAVLLIAWQLTASDRSLSFPPPDEWLKAVVHLYRDGRLVSALLHTFGTYALGLSLAVVVGSALGVAIGLSPMLDRYVSPTMNFVASIPAAALVPVAVLLLGPSPLSGITIVAVIVAWPILLNATAAMRSIPAVRQEMSRTMGLSPLRRWAMVILPSLTPGILLGVIVASSMAIIIALLVDILGAGTGIGRLLVESQQHFDAPAAWGLLLIIGAFGYVMSQALSWLQATVSTPGPPPMTTKNRYRPSRGTIRAS
jgi:ABC-type nitrate/sulfonate/bicarbonate transport system permease component